MPSNWGLHVVVMHKDPGMRISPRPLMRPNCFRATGVELQGQRTRTVFAITAFAIGSKPDRWW